MSDEDRIAQLAEASSQTAAEVETQGARLVEVLARLEALDDLVRALRSSQSDTAERVESLSAELYVSPQVASLSSQLEAARTAQLRTAERVEALATELDRLDTIETTLAHVSREAAASLDERETNLRSELRALSGRQASERDETGRAIASLMNQLKAVDEMDARVGSAERRVAEAVAAQELAAARAEEIASGRQSIEESVLQADRRQQSRIDGLNDQLATLKDEIATWSTRIEAHTETVREARAVADEMSTLARGLHDAHHATEEAQRVSEGRVDSELAAMRSESSDAWERFRQERHNEWQALEAARSQRGEAMDALAGELAATAEALDATSKELSQQLQDQVSALADLRKELAEVLRIWRSGLSDATEVIESGLPQDERSAHAAERREATRRALRAQRDARA